MKSKLYPLMGILFFHLAAYAQVKIGDNATSINTASLLELETTNKGFVLPRVSITSISSSSPLDAGLLTGTLVYNTNSSTTGGSGAGIYYWDGGKWNFLVNTTTTLNYWTLTGNSGTTASSNFIGTTDAIDFVTKTNNTERIRILGAASGSSKAGWIGMGISVPRSSLDVTGNFTNKNVVTIQNTSSSGYSSVDMIDNNGTLKGTFGYGNSGTGSFFSTRDYFSTYGSDFVMNNNNGNFNLFMGGSNGYIGINTSSPSERLHVVGNFYLNGAFMPGGLAGTSGYVLTSAGTGASPTWTNSSSLAWSLIGNTGTTTSNFLGTTDAKSLVFKTNNAEQMRLTQSGALLIKTTSASGNEVLNVNGSFKLGGSGTILTNIIKGTGTISAFTISGVGTTITKTITVTGANTGASVIINPQSSLPDGLVIAYSYVNATNTITVAFVSTLSSISVSALTFDITVIQ